MPSSSPPTPYTYMYPGISTRPRSSSSATRLDSVSSHATHRPHEWVVHPNQCLSEWRQDLTHRICPTSHFTKAPGEDTCGPLRGGGYGLEGAVVMCCLRQLLRKQHECCFLQSCLKILLYCSAVFPGVLCEPENDNTWAERLCCIVPEAGTILLLVVYIIISDSWISTELSQ